LILSLSVESQESRLMLGHLQCSQGQSLIDHTKPFSVMT
jgi:hypothetical protein